VIEQAVALGAGIMLPIKDQFYGDRSGSIADPFEQAWTIATHTRKICRRKTSASGSPISFAVHSA
jgi:PhnB protein